MVMDCFTKAISKAQNQSINPLEPPLRLNAYQMLGDTLYSSAASRLTAKDLIISTHKNLNDNPW
jgi:hypothetical protein